MQEKSSTGFFALPIPSKMLAEINSCARKAIEFCVMANLVLIVFSLGLWVTVGPILIVQMLVHFYIVPFYVFVTFICLGGFQLWCTYEAVTEKDEHGEGVISKWVLCTVLAAIFLLAYVEILPLE